MKKIILFAASLLMTVTLCSCTQSEPGTPIPEIDPTAVLTADDVYAGVNYEYVPALDGSVTTNGNSKKAVYVSNPKGLGDSVSISITQRTDTLSADDVYQIFTQKKSKRTDIIEVTDLGESAYIAFPTLYIYDRGCIIEVTAGSGSDNDQINTLLSFGKVAVANFEEIMPETEDTK